MLEGLREFFRNSVALLSFFSIFSAGMIIVLFSLVFGGHDHGDFGHGDIGHDAQGDHGGESQPGPGVFSLKGIALLAVGFGAIAFIVMYYTNQILVACISGLAIGWVFAFICMAGYRILIRQQSNSLIKSEDVIGQTGQVTTTIPAGGLGEVRLTVDGTAMTKMASAPDGEAIPTGTLVMVRRVSGASIMVEKLPAA